MKLIGLTISLWLSGKICYGRVMNSLDSRFTHISCASSTPTEWPGLPSRLTVNPPFSRLAKTSSGRLNMSLICWGISFWYLGLSAIYLIAATLNLHWLLLMAMYRAIYAKQFLKSHQNVMVSLLVCSKLSWNCCCTLYFSFRSSSNSLMFLSVLSWVSDGGRFLTLSEGNLLESPPFAKKETKEIDVEIPKLPLENGESSWSLTLWN